MTSNFWYLATPYTGYEASEYELENYGKLDSAYRRACEQAGLLIKNHMMVYCPIAHTHPIAEYGKLDHASHDLWLSLDDPFMDAAQGLIVCMLPGWKTSKGISYEVKRFKEMKKPIMFMTPDHMPIMGMDRNPFWDKIHQFELEYGDN